MERFAVGCVLFGGYQLLSLIIGWVPPAHQVAASVAESPNTPQTTFGLFAMLLAAVVGCVLYIFRPGTSGQQRAKLLLVVDFLGQAGDASFLAAWFFFSDGRWWVMASLVIAGIVAIGLSFVVKEMLGP